MTLNPDTVFQHILEIKETVVRTEEKVSALSGLEIDDRLRSLEGSRSKVYGFMWTLGLAWAGLLAWINGLGDWIRR